MHEHLRENADVSMGIIVACLIVAALLVAAYTVSEIRARQRMYRRGFDLAAPFEEPSRICETCGRETL